MLVVCDVLVVCCFVLLIVSCVSRRILGWLCVVVLCLGFVESFVCLFSVARL